MKRKRLFSALMALAMILSLCTFASAGAVTPAPVALAPGSAKLGANASALVDDDHLTVSGIGDEANQTVPAALAEAVISYTVTVVDTPANDTTSPATAAVHTAIATITAQTSVTGWTAQYKTNNSLDLLTTTAAIIEITDNTNTVEVTVTPDGQAPLVRAAANGATLAGEIKLGKAGAFRPAVAANTDGQLNSYAQDSVSGEVTNEGPLPDDVINVKVPTDAQTKNAFDLYLDPHDLIKDSSATRYGTGISATGDSRLYFKNSATAMSNTSNALTIVNKSSVAVSVDLSVEATKNNASDFTFVSSADAVDTATGAAIYLALKSGTDVKAIDNTADATSGKNIAKIETSIETGDWYDLVWHGAEKLGYYSYDMKPALASATDDSSFESLTFNLTGKINDNDAWTPGHGASDLTFGLSVIWEVKAYVPRPGATVATALTGANTALTLNLDFGESPYNKAKADITINSQKETKDAPTSGHTLSYTYTFTGNAVAYDRLADSATVVFYDSSPTEAGAVTVPLTGIKASS